MEDSFPTGSKEERLGRQHLPCCDRGKNMHDLTGGGGECTTSEHSVAAKHSWRKARMRNFSLPVTLTIFSSSATGRVRKRSESGRKRGRCCGTCCDWSCRWRRRT